ncbi:MAG: protease pro-enzyme activation domain-containing protein, partial [Bryobacteraceae bacterium]
MPRIRTQFICKLAAVASLLAVAAGLMAQTSRITAAIDNSRRVTLTGHLHPLARPEYDGGAADPSTKLTFLTLLLKPSAGQRSDLAQLLAEQQDPTSPNYHRWLTPEQYADRFGVSSDDLAKIKNWLEQQGLQVTGVARGRNWVSFNGTVGQVQQAFQTEIHQYNVKGQMHIANTADPSVPAAIGAVVSGVRGLNDFHLRPLLKPRSAAPA